MTIKMKINDKVVLDTFLGTKKSGKTVDSNENYWILIGQKGKIVEIGERRLLIVFECDIDSFQLENHNHIKNSLWILPTDLKIIN